MGAKIPLEQRTRVESGFAERRSLAFRISRQAAWTIFAGGLVFTGLLDVLTGDRIWVGPLYICFLGLAAWAVGFKEAVGGLFAAIGFSYFANSGAIYPYHEAVTLWDVIMRAPPAFVVILLLAHARASCEREWRLARTDPLTGALNRKAFFELAGTIEEARTWHLLAYADLDGLKRLNDAEGHERGDESLLAFASSVKEAIRKDDIFARMGGDEFIVYMAVRDEASGHSVAKRLHRAMNAATSQFADGLQCSVGVLILEPGKRSIDRELRSADQLMYQAKQEGAALSVATGREIGEHFLLANHWKESSPMQAAAAAAGEEQAASERQIARSRGKAA